MWVIDIRSPCDLGCGNVMEKVMESHGILRVQNSTDLEELLIF